MKKLLVLIGIVFFFIVFGVNSFTFIVNQDEIGVVKNFGKIVEIIINEDDMEDVLENLTREGKDQEIKVTTKKGLHFKIPFVQTVETFTSKNLTYRSTPEVSNTKDNKRIEISMYAQYRIVDPLIFKLTIGTRENVRAKMDNRVYPVVINSANNLNFNEFFIQETLDEMIDARKEELNADLLKDFGIYVTDIGIYRKNFPSSNMASIEQKMTMQIEKETESLLAEGDKAYEEAKARTDRERKEILAEATEESAVIKAAGDTDALGIYQESLQKDLSFYQFIQRMNIYKGLEGTTIFLDKDNSILEYMNQY